MVGTDLAGDTVVRQRLAAGLKPLLQTRLVIAAEVLGALGILDVRPKFAQEERARRIEAAVEVNGGDQRLTGVGEQRLFAPAAGLFLPTAQNHVIAKAKLLGEFRER